MAIQLQREYKTLVCNYNKLRSAIPDYKTQTTKVLVDIYASLEARLQEEDKGGELAVGENVVFTDEYNLTGIVATQEEVYDRLMALTGGQMI